MSRYPEDMTDTGCGAEPPYGRGSVTTPEEAWELIADYYERAGFPRPRSPYEPDAPTGEEAQTHEH